MFASQSVVDGGKGQQIFKLSKILSPELAIPPHVVLWGTRWGRQSSLVDERQVKITPSPATEGVQRN